MENFLHSAMHRTTTSLCVPWVSYRKIACSRQHVYLDVINKQNVNRKHVYGRWKCYFSITYLTVDKWLISLWLWSFNLVTTRWLDFEFIFIGFFERVFNFKLEFTYFNWFTLGGDARALLMKLFRFYKLARALHRWHGSRLLSTLKTSVINVNNICN